ncbi:Predicted DNA-binding protein, MmcQ/YjbR family [Thalassotalea agarivorans]|uniref:Predicted DNA-binding protein, MmcQ/YjbR family n=2 Tax=Thalassotalea agarivorans TaxID=349064 RepID=A0A1I0CF21_THASX|nr:Predicted DNA-binding protein, MmcQ/YjbR family [Thalassotalea agarivorans]
MPVNKYFKRHMTVAILRTYLLDKPRAQLDFPFGEEIEVYKVKGKMFATLAIGKMGKGDGDKREYWMNLKCDPNEAIMLRDVFDAVIPGYHMNKQHWNTVIIDGSIPQGEIERMIDSSFDLVVGQLTKKEQTSINVLK